MLRRNDASAACQLQQPRRGENRTLSPPDQEKEHVGSVSPACRAESRPPKRQALRVGFLASRPREGRRPNEVALAPTRSSVSGACRFCAALAVQAGPSPTRSAGTGAVPAGGREAGKYTDGVGCRPFSGARTRRARARGAEPVRNYQRVSGALVGWRRTGRCWRVRLSQLLMSTPAPVIPDSPPDQKPESGEGRR
jgi:hypothetical protein